MPGTESRPPSAAVSETETLEQPEARASTPIKESWFEAEIKGNALVPQRALGIMTFVADAVLNDPPARWTDLPHCRLSPDQLERIGAIMSAMHRRHKVPFATETARAQFPEPDKIQIVKTNQLQALWKHLSEGLTRLLCKYAQAVENSSEKLAAPAGQAEKVQAFFSDEQNQTAIDQLKLIFAVLKQTFADPAVAALIKKYHESLSVPRKPGKRYTTAVQMLGDTVSEEIKRLARRSLSAAVPKPLVDCVLTNFEVTHDD